ncbi:ribonuclease H family protein [Aspergillus affinis]|uniref:ribonuclease H family protein n=1 Tax=Aspergillus affinis TaxID=1070780 RepID=UPI0022FF3A1C|nr:reverse transcriptase [Aspergillus affinis]KAI9040114.1 reverse transcriptase [Aspergillus affinis]
MLYLAPLFWMGKLKARFGAILPVYRTTSIPALYRESGLLLAEIELEYIAAIATVCFRRFDPYHPLRRRAERAIQTGLQTSRFAYRVLALPESEQLNPLQNLLWLLQEERETAQQRIRVPAENSKLENRMAGNGYALYQSGKLFQQSSFSLGPNKEVFDAEAEAALAGVKAALKLDTARFVTDFWVCLDNLEVATRLLSPFAGLSQGIFESFQALARTWPARERFSYTNGGSVRVC